MSVAIYCKKEMSSKCTPSPSRELQQISINMQLLKNRIGQTLRKQAILVCSSREHTTCLHYRMCKSAYSRSPPLPFVNFGDLYFLYIKPHTLSCSDWLVCIKIAIAFTWEAVEVQYLPHFRGGCYTMLVS